MVFLAFHISLSERWTSQNRWSTIGFYPDVSDAGGFSTANSKFAPANRTSNNSNLNEGLTERLKYVLDDTGATLDGVVSSALGNLIDKGELAMLYISHTSNVSAGTAADATNNIVGKSAVIQNSVKATIMLKDIHPLFEVMPISKSLNFKIQIFWNNSVATATHNATEWTAQISQYRSYNGTLPLMLNNITDGFQGAGGGTLRATVYVGETCYDSQQKSVTNSGLEVEKLVNKWNYTFKLFKCSLTLKSIMPRIIFEMFLTMITTNSL